MSDLIDRQAAIDTITAYPHGDVWNVENMENMVYEIKNLPPAQPEIVRCGDCKHYYFADNRIPQEQRYTCELDGDRWNPDSFCSFAERRNECVGR